MDSIYGRLPGFFDSQREHCIFYRFYSFEKTLKQKLSQKATGNANEETVLLKAFKYFDLNNNGTVEPDEFAKACEKIGVMIPTSQVSSLRSFGRSNGYKFSKGALSIGCSLDSS